MLRRRDEARLRRPGATLRLPGLYGVHIYVDHGVERRPELRPYDVSGVS